MKHAFQNLALLLLGLFGSIHQASAQLYEVPFDEKIRNSTLIVEGKVAESESYRAANGAIYTAHKVVVVGLLKGSYREHDLTVTTWGGTVGDETQTWSHLLTLQKGDYGIFFLEPTQAPETENRQFAKPCFDVYASQQGFLRFAQNETGVWIAQEPFHTYTDLKKEVYQEIASATGQQPEVLNASESAVRSGVRYAFKDVTFDGSKFTFNIYANSLIDNKKLYQSGIIMGYNPDFFGDSIATNGNLELQTAGISSSTSTYSLSKTDLASNKVQIQLQTVGSVSGLTTLTTSEQLLASGSLAIENIFADPGLFYDTEEMLALNKFYNTDAGGFPQLFDTVVVDTDFPFELYAPVIDSIRPLSLRAGTSDVLTIYGKNFGNTQGSSYVEFTDASEGITNGINWIQPLTKDYTSWSENQIKVVVPSVCIDNNTTTTDVYTGTGKVRVRVSGSTVQSDEKLIVRFAAYNTFYPDSGGVDKRKIVRLADWNENGGYNLYYTNELKNLTGGVAAFERALNTWRCATNINFVVIDTTPPSYLLPFRCRIHYGALPAGVPSSTKATTTPTFGSCANGPNAIFLGYMKNFDMVFKSSGINWHTATSMPTLNWNTELDFESFALHELGHAGLLRHTNNGDDLMYYRVEEYKRELEANDLEGGIYEKDLGISNDPNNCTTPMSPYLCTNSIDEGDQGWKFIKIVPNPISEQFYIEFECESNRDFQITILAIDGQMVLQNRIARCRDVVDIKNFKPGVYIVKILTNTGIIHYGKIIKG